MTGGRAPTGKSWREWAAERANPGKQAAGKAGGHASDVKRIKGLFGLIVGETVVRTSYKCPAASKQAITWYVVSRSVKGSVGQCRVSVSAGVCASHLS